MKHYNVTKNTNGDSYNYTTQGTTREYDINNSTNPEIHTNQRQKSVKFETNGDTLNSNNQDQASRREYETSTHESQRKTQSNSVSSNNKTKLIKNFEQGGEIDLINAKTKTESLSVRRVHKVNKISRTGKYTQSTSNEISFSSKSTMHNTNTERSNLTRRSVANHTGDLSAVYSVALKCGNSENIKENITTCSKTLADSHSHFVLKNSESYIDHTHLDYGRVDLVDSTVINWRSNCVKKFYGVKRDMSQQNRLVNCIEDISDRKSKENMSPSRSCVRLEISNRNDFFIKNISQVVENQPKQEYKLETYSIDLINEEKGTRVSSFAILNQKDEFKLETYSINLLSNEEIEKDNLEVKDALNDNKENSLIENKIEISPEVKYIESTEGLLINKIKNIREDGSQNQVENDRLVEGEKVELKLNHVVVIDKNNENISVEDVSRNDEVSENNSNIVNETSDLCNSYNYDHIRIKSEQQTTTRIENSFDLEKTKEITIDGQSMKSFDNLHESKEKKQNLNKSSEVLILSVDLDKVIVINHELKEQEKILVNISDAKEENNSNIVEMLKSNDNNFNLHDVLSDLNITTPKIAVDIINENNEDHLVSKSKTASNCISRKEKNKKNNPNRNNDCVIDNTNTLEIIKDKEIKINSAVINTSFKIANDGEIIYSNDDTPLADYKQDVNEEKGDIIRDFQDNVKEDQKLLIDTSSNSLIAYIENETIPKPNLIIKHENNSHLSKISKEDIESTEDIEFKEEKDICNKLEPIHYVKENLPMENFGKIKYEHTKRQLSIISEEQMSPVTPNLISNRTSPKTSNNLLIIEDIYSYTYNNQSEKDINKKMQNAEVHIGVKSPYEIQVSLNQRKKKVYEKRRPYINCNYAETSSGGVKLIKNYEFVEILSDKDILSVSKPLNSQTEESRLGFVLTKEENTEEKENLNDRLKINSSTAEEADLNLNDNRLVSKTIAKNLLSDKNAFGFSLVNITADKSSYTDNKIEKEINNFSNLNNLPVNIINNNDQISSYSLLVDNKYNKRQKKLEEDKSEGKSVNSNTYEDLSKNSIKFSEDDGNNILVNEGADELSDHKNIRFDTEKFIPEYCKNSNLTQFLTNISNKKQKENLNKIEDKIEDLNQVEDKIYDCNFIQPQEISKLEEIKYEINSNNYYKQSTELSDKSNENKNKTSFIQIYQKSKLNLNNSKGKKYYPEKFENWQLNINTSRVNESNQNTSTNNKKEKSFVKEDKVKHNRAEASNINKPNFISEEEKKIEISNNSNLTNQKLKATPIKKKFITIKDKSFNKNEGYKNIRYDLQKDTAATIKNRPIKNEISVLSDNWQDDSFEKSEKENFKSKIHVVPKLEFNDRSQIDIIMMKYGLSNEERSNKLNHTNNNENNKNNNNISSLHKSPKQKTGYNFDYNLFNLKISPKIKQIPRNDLNKSTNSNIGNRLNDSSLINPLIVNRTDKKSLTQPFQNIQHTRIGSNDYTNISSFNYTGTKPDNTAQKTQIEKDHSNCNNSSASFIQNSNFAYKQSHVDKLAKNILDKSRLNNSNTCDNLNYKTNPMKTIKQTYEEYISHLNQIADSHNINSLKINLDNYRFEYDHNVKKINNLINDYKTTLSECECDINCRICFEFYLKHNHYLYSNQKRGKLFYNLKENKELIKVQSASFFSDKNSRDSVLNSSCMKKSFDNSNNSNINLNTKRLSFPVIYPSNKL